MRSTFEKAKPYLLKHEGGYVDHPSDPGGATNMGITIGTLSAYRGRKVSKQDVKNLTKAEALLIYKKNYWDKVKGDKLPAGVDYSVYDFAVNSGPSRAAKYLQKIVGVKQDGAIGPKTLAHVAKKSPEEIINRLNDDRLIFMKRIKSGKLWKVFGKGWGRRVAEVRKVSLEFAKDSPEVESKPVPQPPRKPVQPVIEDLNSIPTKTKEPSFLEALFGIIMDAIKGRNGS